LTKPVTGPGPELIETARAELSRRDAALAVAHAAVKPFEWRLRPRGFSGLVKMIVEQQVSIAAAAAIWGRFETGLAHVTPEAVLAAEDAVFRSAGVSGPKTRYIRAIAEAHMGRTIDLERVPELSDDEVLSALTAVKGVGRWTAENYLLFCEGRLDAFPAGDVALQEGLRLAEAGQGRPTEKALYARAEGWRPYRGVAAHLLWAYYGGVRRGEIAPTEGGASPQA
jgi:DNA-3-methyladenine glycosylase II